VHLQEIARPVSTPLSVFFLPHLLEKPGSASVIIRWAIELDSSFGTQPQGENE
jgi:hypothetical protein